MTTTVGRPKQFRNAADKQKAYRERQKVEVEHFELAEAMLNLIEARAQSLRNSVLYWRAKGQRLEIVHSNFGHSDLVKAMRGGQFHDNVEGVVFHYLLKRGELVQIGNKRPFGETVYEFVKAEPAPESLREK
jgi:hypothetical protein